jgi:hypothetical protein
MLLIERHQRHIEIVKGYRDEYKTELDQLNVVKLTNQDRDRMIYILDRIRYANSTISIIEQAIAKIKLNTYAEGRT